VEHRVLMYSRQRCHLCDDARAALMAVRGTVPFLFDEVDIDSDDVLVKEYGIRIPVVLVDGEELFEYRVDVGALEEVLSQGRARPFLPK